MKKYQIFIASIFIILLSSCTSQTYLLPQELQSVLEKKEYTFMATRAIPSSGDAARLLSGTHSTAAGRILELDYGYTLEIKESTLTVTLPYFGRAYTGSLDPEKQSHRFTSKNFSYVQTKGRKNTTVITMRPNDVQHIQHIVMEVYPNAKAYLTIQASDRQLISYDGYLKENQEK